jgi:hypothetical protein
MVGDSRIDHVVFTGSVHGGTRISQAAAGRFLQIGYELGGNDPAYVAADADLARSADGLVDGAMYNAGQSCCAVERAYVHASHYDAFVAAAKELAEKYVLGDPLDPATTLGPIAQPAHVAELEALVADALRRGARRVTGGKRTSVGGRHVAIAGVVVDGVTDRPYASDSAAITTTAAAASTSGRTPRIARRLRCARASPYVRAKPGVRFLSASRNSDQRDGPMITTVPHDAPWNRRLQQPS